MVLAPAYSSPSQGTWPMEVILLSQNFPYSRCVRDIAPSTRRPVYRSIFPLATLQSVPKLSFLGPSPHFLPRVVPFSALLVSDSRF